MTDLIQTKPINTRFFMEITMALVQVIFLKNMGIGVGLMVEILKSSCAMVSNSLMRRKNK